MKKANIIFVVIFLCIQSNGLSQWIVLNSPISVDLKSVIFFSKDTGYVIGENYFMKTKDGGQSWSYYQPTQQKLTSMFFIDKKFGYVGGYNVILKTKTGGTSWNDVTPQGIPGIYKIVAMHFHSFDTGFALTSTNFYNSVLVTVDGGENWYFHGYNMGSSYTLIYSLHFPVKNIGYSCAYRVHYASGKGMIFKTIDGGLTWKKLTSFSFDKSEGFSPYVVFFIDSLKGFVGGSKGCFFYSPYCEIRLYMTTDGGQTWDSTATNPQASVMDIFFPDANIGYLVDELGYIYKSTDGGIHWNIQYYAGKPLYSIHCVDSQTCYAVGADGLILKTTTGGAVDIDDEQKSFYFIYPNPFTEQTTIFIGNKNNHKIEGADRLRIYLTDIYGIVLKVLHEGTLTNDQLIIKGSELQSGLYLCIIESETERHVLKLIKQ